MSKPKRATLLMLACGLLLAALPTVLAQKNKSSRRQPALAQEEENSRRFWPPNFRPGATAPKPQPRTDRYQPVTPMLSATTSVKSRAEAVLGVTLWRLHPAEEGQPLEKERNDKGQKAEETARGLVRRKNGQQTYMTFERVEANTPFNVNQMLRLSVEVPRTGYLYVIDREQYADGTLGDPYLLFPEKLYGGENRVSAGRIIEIPNSEEPWEFEDLSEAGKQWTGEMLIFIVSPRPLNLRLRPRTVNGLPLDKAQIETWEKTWGAQVEQSELQDGAGSYRTRAEFQAVTNKGQRLTRNDPLPQTVFRMAAKPGNPLLVRLLLKVGK